jgi:hypothetical protein
MSRNLNQMDNPAMGHFRVDTAPVQGREHKGKGFQSFD